MYRSNGAHDFILFKFLKGVRVNIDFIYAIRYTNYKS
jgi:hypothetical protein